MKVKLLKVHVIAAVVALLSVATLLGLAVFSELSPDRLATVRKWIAYGLLVLVPALVATGITGAQLARNHRGRLVEDKLRRMRVVAANGVLVLLPAALWLASRAQAGDTEGLFRVVQLVELAFGAANLRLLLLNLRDGMRLCGHRLQRAPTGRVIRRA